MLYGYLGHTFIYLQCMVFTLLCTTRDDEKMGKKIEISFYSNKNIEHCMQFELNWIWISTIQIQFRSNSLELNSKTLNWIETHWVEFKSIGIRFEFNWIPIWPNSMQIQFEKKWGAIWCIKYWIFAHCFHHLWVWC